MKVKRFVALTILLIVAWCNGLVDEGETAEAGVCPSMMQTRKKTGVASKQQKKLDLREQFPGHYSGELAVHLDPTDSNSPVIKLEVMKVKASDKVPRKGALLMHLGGPGSDASAGYTAGYFVSKLGFDAYGISQRGIGRLANPSLMCNDFHLPPKGQGPYKVSDFTNCSCRLADGTPMIGEAWANIDPGVKWQVKELFEKTAERSQRCRKSFDMPSGHNFLDYVGTQVLAYDIEELRKAIGEDTLSLWGISYGTYVAGVYASIYPQRVDKVIMDGNVVPMPEKTALASGCGIGIQQSINKLLYNCKEQADKCSLKDPDVDFGKLLKKLRWPGIKARTESGKGIRLTIGLLGGWMQEQLVQSAGWQGVPPKLAALLYGSREDQEKAAGEILDSKCYLLDPATGKKVYTWREYDVCIGAAHISGADNHGSSFMAQLAVLGNDLAGRFTVNDAVGLWSAFSEEHRAISAGSYVGILSGLFQWPVVPTPPAPLGNPNVKALILGNLYDPSTSYSWSQEMHKVFPSGKMMTWQGVGHGLVIPEAYDPKGSTSCIKNIFKFLNGTDDDLANGHTCRLTQPIPTSLLQAHLTTLLSETELDVQL